MTEREDNVHTVWTETELDEALAALHPATPPGESALTAAREALERESLSCQQIPPSTVGEKRPPWHRWAAIGTAAAAVAAAVTVSLTLPGHHVAAAVPLSPAGTVLNETGLAAIRHGDPVIRPGQYRYLLQDEWAQAQVSGTSAPVLAENTAETWIPFHQNGIWQLRTKTTGATQPIPGAVNVPAAGPINYDDEPPATVNAPCGDFTPSPGLAPSCTDPNVHDGNAQNPTVAWLNSLPRDPAQLLAAIRTGLREESSPAPPPSVDGTTASPPGPSDADLFEYLVTEVTNGALPADRRGELLQAMALIPGVRVTGRSVSLNGHTGVGVGLTDEQHRLQEIVLDPAAGTIVGERLRAMTSSTAFPAGAVMEYSTYRTAVVDGIGERPTS